MKLKNKNDIKIAYTILQINPTAVFSISGDDVNKIEWLEGTTPISNEDILAKQIELQADYDAKQYQRDRVYPSIQDQLDMQYWDNVNGTTTWKDAIAKVKSDNPKE
jgi:hypothetical protein